MGLIMVKKNNYTFILWMVAVILTILSVIYQRITGPTYPLRGETLIGGISAKYNLDRSHGGFTDHRVVINTSQPVSGKILYKLYGSNDNLTEIPMQYSAGVLSGDLPKQLPEVKLDYMVQLENGTDKVQIPSRDLLTIRFKGIVSVTILIPHIIFIFAAMLISLRAGLQAAFGQDNPEQYTKWVISLLFFGGFVFGCIVQKYAFDAYWTGFPFGNDLTDNKTLIAMIVWLTAWIASKKTPYARAWIIAASVVTFVVFLIPHSLHLK